MARQKDAKTNAMRILDSMDIPYRSISYRCDEFIDGIKVADMLGLPREAVYKTLVTVGADGDYFVFVIPVAAELDLKAAARSIGEKSVEMLHVKDINAVTGYVRGGCTPVGMKKQFVTRIDASAGALPEIYVSGGRVGLQIALRPDDLARASGAEYAKLTRG